MAPYGGAVVPLLGWDEVKLVGKRDFGTVRKLPSGRWQARYHDASGVRHARSFATKADASRFLAGARSDLDRGNWFDPHAGEITFRAYAEQWLVNRRVRGRPLAPRTRERYDGVLRVHILPALGEVELRHLSVPTVRAWYGRLTASGKPGASTVAKTYRLLHAICATATADELMARNPCTIPGASVERAAERPVAALGQVYDLAAAVPAPYRAMILLATFCGLRFGELAGLRLDRLDLMHSTVTVVEDLDELDGGRLQRGEVKSDVSRRVVSIPAVIVPDLEQHIGRYTEGGASGLVFVGVKGGRLRRANFRKIWLRAVRGAGIRDGFRFHDLRHTGNTLAAATGASTRELMVRMGQASPRAALMYQHATRDRDAAIAAALSDLVGRERSAPRQTVTSESVWGM